MSQVDGRPQKPSDVKLPRFLRFVDPAEPKEVAELAVKDTGETTPDGKRIYALHMDMSEVGSKTVTDMIYVSIAPGATFTGSAFELKNNKGIAITVLGTFHASATAGMEVWLESSHDGVAWDSVDTTFVTGLEPVFTAGQLKQKTTLVDSSPKYIRIICKNLDATYGIAGVSGLVAVVD